MTQIAKKKNLYLFWQRGVILATILATRNIFVENLANIRTVIWWLFKHERGHIWKNVVQ
jgi:hypothetical protein